MKYLSKNLDKSHKRDEFNCGIPLLDNYLRKQALQEIKRKLSACFVITEPKSGLLIGYYTLSNNSIPQNFIPQNIQKKLPTSYTSIPTTLIGRLAVDKRFQGKGFGKFLLIDALKRTYEVSQKIASFAVVVDPFDNKAESFYKNYVFIKLPDSGKMFLPMKTIAQLFK